MWHVGTKSTTYIMYFCFFFIILIKAFSYGMCNNSLISLLTYLSITFFSSYIFIIFTFFFFRKPKRHRSVAYLCWQLLDLSQIGHIFSQILQVIPGHQRYKYLSVFFKKTFTGNPKRPLAISGRWVFVKSYLVLTTFFFLFLEFVC